MISLKFIPLSFITSNDEIIRQIKNTIVFSHLFETCQETTLSNYIETTQYGFTASALEKGSHRMLRITDINHSRVDWESVPFCDCPDDEKYLLKDNDILVARTGGTTGKSFFVENPPLNAVFASYLIRIRLKKDVNIEFINAFLNSYCFWNQIVEMKAGSAQPNVNAEKLKVLVIPDCDLETQAKAVRLIKEVTSDSIREKINLVESLFWNNNKISTELNHQLALVKELRQAFLSEAMQGKYVPQDERDEPAEILLEKIRAEKEKLAAEKRIKRDKPLPPINAEEIPFEIPEHWTWCRIEELFFTLSPRGKQIRAKHYKKEGLFPVVDQGWKQIVGYYDDESLLIKVSEPVIIFGDHTKEIKFVDFNFIPGADGTKILSINKPLNIKWFFHFLKSLRLENKGYSRHFKVLKKTIVPLPPLAEQERIVAKLEKLMKFCDELEANIWESKTQAETLLQVALKEALRN